METRTTLMDLPSNILNNEVVKPTNLDTKSLLRLSSVNRDARYTLFNPALLEHLKRHCKRSAKKQVEALLNIHPNFNVCDLHHIFLAALKDRDIDLCKVITKERKNELAQIELPKKLVDESNTYDFSAVIAAIESGQNVKEALVKMRADLDKIVKEKGFPLQALLDACEIHDEKTSWTYEKSKIFTIKVIGYLQRLSPAWLKKALATGIYRITVECKICGDTFILQSGESIDPATDVPNKGLGFDFYVNLFGRLSLGGGNRITLVDFLKNYLEQQQQSLVSLCSEVIQHQKPAHA